MIERYNLFLDFDDCKYSGVVEIRGKFNDELVLDYKDMDVLDVTDDENRRLKYVLDGEKIRIKTGDKSSVVVKFLKRLSSQTLVGIYKTKEGMITTQFEPNFASSMFPCVDNPEEKAVFKLSVRVKKGLSVISNMPVERIEDNGEKVTYVFMDTPRMSTYLLYLGIGNFEEVVDDSAKPKIIVATLKGRSDKAKFPLEVARKTLAFYGNYFKIPYQLPKLHLIAVPEFLAGAMENWGAITFRESALLADENSSIITKTTVIEVIAHEMAHQWFGNLVTLKWWDDLWLNESFATFMAYKFGAKVYPQLGFDGLFYFIETVSAMLEDSISSTHPIEAKVSNPVEINELFDGISYGKGASVLRMIEAYIGEENFRHGVINYLNKFKFSNAKGEDLWNSLSEISRENVNEILKDWITKPGYPVIYVSAEGNKIRLKQERFSLVPLEKFTYKVPVTLEVNGKLITKLLDKEEDVIEMNEEVKSLKVNVDRSGFYRVYYEDLEYVFKANLNDKELAGLFDDYFNFFMAGMVNYNVAEALIRKLMNFKGYITSSLISQRLSLLYNVNPNKYEEIAKEFYLSQVRLWKGSDDELGKMVYSNLIEGLAFIDYDFALGMSELFQYYDRIDPNLKTASVIAYSVVTSDVNTLMEKYKGYTFDEDKQRFLNGLLSIRDGTRISQVFSHIHEFKLQDLFSIVVGYAMNPFTRKTYFDFFLSQFNMFKDYAIKVSGGLWGLGRVVSEVVPYLGLENPEEINAFLDKIYQKELDRDFRSARDKLTTLLRLK